LIIYVILSIAIAYLIDPVYLLGDYNILTKIAWFSPLVIAGIWGATLSSALGGILGGPRILQAISLDKIAPKFLGKGYGLTNEPRNALILIFLIAEGGILIGKLDVIAEVVSMFYLASYGFINLAYVLEKWASTDFRPSFKIHISLGIIGFITSFAIMFKLGVASMIASFLIMGLIYFIIKRRQVKTEFGDVWQSVWTSITRRALQKMSEKEIEERNWKPNILLFSGSTNKRKYLLEFGKSIVGKHGILSNFDLVENPNLDMLFSKNIQNTELKNENIPGVFTIQQSCKNVYQGIEMVATTYGFSGVEPNTIMMGWGRHSQNPTEFVSLIKKINKLDYNVLLMDYDKLRGFGNKKQINIWVESSNNYGKLSLLIAKFLTSSIDWDNSIIRVLLVNIDNASASQIRKKIITYLDDQRLEAEVLVINNEIEKKSFYEIVKVESYHADVVMIGIPDIVEGEEIEFVEKTSALCEDIGTVVLVKASSIFANMMLDVNKPKLSENDNIDSFVKTAVDEKDVVLPRNKALESEVVSLYQKFNDNFNNTIFQFSNNVYLYHKSYIDNIKELCSNSFDTIKARYSKYDSVKLKNLIYSNQNNVLLKSSKQIENYIKEITPELNELFKTNVDIFVKDNQAIIDSCPKKIAIRYTKEELKNLKEDNFSERSFKTRKNFFKSFGYKVKFKELIKTKTELQSYQNTYDLLSEFGMINVQYIIEYQKLIQNINKSFVYLSVLAEKGELNDEIITEQEKLIIDEINKLQSYSEKTNEIIRGNFYEKTKQKINNVSLRLNKVNSNRYIREHNYSKKINLLKKKISTIPEKWISNDTLLNNAISTEIRLFALNGKLKSYLSDYSNKINIEISKVLVNEYERFSLYLKDININKSNEVFETEINEQSLENLLISLNVFLESLLSKLHKSSRNFPEKIEVIDSSVLNEFEKNQYEDFKPIKIHASRLLDYLFLNKLEEPLFENYALIKNKLEESFELINDTRRLVDFSINDNNVANKEEIENLLKDRSLKINSELTYLKELLNDNTDKINSVFSDLLNKLIYDVFISTASNLKQYITKQEMKKKKVFIRVNYINFKKLYNDKVAQFIFAKSKALNIKKDIDETNDLFYGNINSILNIKNKLSPKPEVIVNIPLYYRQFFTNKDSYHKDFWVGRQAELESANNSIKRFYQGSKGAIAVIGEQGSGKSFFLNYIAKSFTDNKNIFHIVAPETGSINKDDFDNAALNAFSEKVFSSSNIFRHFPENSIVILDDLELWWEKSENGNQLLEYIFEIVNKHSSRILFLISMNSFVADLIFKLNDINSLFINIIKLKNVDSKTLRDIVMLRHKSGGLTIYYKNKKLNKIREANLFNKLYKYSYGNINTALNLWLSKIDKYENETIFIDFPHINTFDLENIKTEDLLYLSQFVLHKNLTVNKLVNVMHTDKMTAIRKIKFLLRAGLIVKHNRVYYLDKYMISITINILKEKGIL
jgi:hypothetical protein